MKSAGGRRGGGEAPGEGAKTGARAEPAPQGARVVPAPGRVWAGSVALPPSPSWYGSHLGDWDSAGLRFAYAAGGSLVVLRPRDLRVAACLTPPRPPGGRRGAARPPGRYSAVCFLSGSGLRSVLVASRSPEGELHFWDALSGTLLRRAALPRGDAPLTDGEEATAAGGAAGGSWDALEVHEARTGAVLCAGSAGLVALVGGAGAGAAEVLAALGSPISCLAWRGGPDARGFRGVGRGSGGGVRDAGAGGEVGTVGPSDLFGGLWAAAGLETGHLVLVRTLSAAAATEMAAATVTEMAKAGGGRRTAQNRTLDPVTFEGAHEGAVQSLQWGPPLSYPAPGSGEGPWRVRLLSSGRDRLVKIWSAEFRQEAALGPSTSEPTPALLPVATLRLPGPARPKSGADPGSRTWVSATWTCGLRLADRGAPSRGSGWGDANPRSDPSGVLASLEGGDLVWWGCPLGHLGSRSTGPGGPSPCVRLSSGHTRPVFLLALRPPRGGRGGAAGPPQPPLLASLSMDRQVRFLDLPALAARAPEALAWAVPGLGGFPYSLSPSPFLPGTTACGGGDGCVRVWSRDGSRPPETLWRGLAGDRVQAVAWSPLEDGVVAFGTAAGAVGLVRLAQLGGQATRLAEAHSKPVLSLSWLKITGESGVQEDASPALLLLSCAGDGQALWRRVQPPSAAAARGRGGAPFHPRRGGGGGALPFRRPSPSGGSFCLASPAHCAQWAPEADLLASGHACGAVLLSRVRAAAEGLEAVVTAVLRLHPRGPVSALSWDASSPGFPRVASGGAGGSVALATAAGGGGGGSPALRPRQRRGPRRPGVSSGRTRCPAAGRCAPWPFRRRKRAASRRAAATSGGTPSSSPPAPRRAPGCTASPRRGPYLLSRAKGCQERGLGGSRSSCSSGGGRYWAWRGRGQGVSSRGTRARPSRSSTATTGVGCACGGADPVELRTSGRTLRFTRYG